MLRSLDRSIGICNGTRLIVENFSRSVIFAKVASGNRTGDLVAIPWITFISEPDQTGLPFKLICTQFPVNLAFSLTINKSQGQTIGNVGIVLHEPVLSHGQLYVALSRSKSSHTTKAVIPQPENGLPSYQTSNIFYEEVLSRVHWSWWFFYQLFFPFLRNLYTAIAFDYFPLPLYLLFDFHLLFEFHFHLSFKLVFPFGFFFIWTY